MRIAVRQEADSIEVVAIEGRRKIGSVDAQVTSWEDLMEASNEALDRAQDLWGREATAKMREAQLLERCARAYDRVQRQVRRKLALFSVVGAKMADVPEREAKIARLYRTAAIVAGRRGAALMAEPCADRLFGGADLALAKTAWFRSGFARGLVQSGPVVYAPPSAPGHAANPEAIQIEGMIDFKNRNAVVYAFLGETRVGHVVAVDRGVDPFDECLDDIAALEDSTGRSLNKIWAVDASYIEPTFRQRGLGVELYATLIELVGNNWPNSVVVADACESWRTTSAMAKRVWQSDALRRRDLQVIGMAATTPEGPMEPTSSCPRISKTVRLDHAMERLQNSTLKRRLLQ